jgi:5-methyltetrahydropteroyltriglutamate--homocysteine methyltransferase
VLEVFVPAVSPTSVELWQSNRYYPTQEEYLFAIAGAYSFEGTNPRHEHEWQIWETTTLPDGAILIPGVITQSSVLVEHPELVAQRLVRYANCVGKENLIAGADCGFGTFAGLEEVQERVAWAKLEALVQGARLASRQLA